MQFEVGDKAAEIIAGTFYKSLALNFPVDAALTEARRQIALLDRDSLEWVNPVLQTLSECGRTYEDAIAALKLGDKDRGAELLRSIIGKCGRFRRCGQPVG